MKTVDLPLAESDATLKEAAAHSVRGAAKQQIEAAPGNRIFTRHGGNVLPTTRTA
jgi:hypothetical protein